MSEKTGNKTIAKNTAFLYFRMLFIMVVSLYTSRVVLQYLGVDDYGIYQAVGGIVAMLAFLNNVFATGSARFLTFELGKGDKEKLHRTFCTTLNIHIGIALLVVIVAETVGLWFFYNKLGIPQERMHAAEWVYHLSVATVVFTFTRIPFSSSVIAHEKMGIFAYVSIIEELLKLGIVFLLSVTTADKLIVYAFLYFLIHVGAVVFYYFYCYHHFEETHYKPLFDRAIFKDIFSFSSWTVITQVSIAVNSQGSTILTNMFFGPAVVTARAISMQVNMAAHSFVSNFRTAVNPQIVKRYAAGDVVGSRRLLLNSTVYSYYLMYLLALPIFLLAEPLIQLWLGQTPPYSVIFLQLIIIQSLFCVFDTSFYTALYTKGRLKENAIISPLFGLIQFPVVYVLFKMGCSPVALSWASIITYAILGLVIKPILIHKVAEYPAKEILAVYKPCLTITVISAPFVLLCDYFIEHYCGMVLHFILVTIVSVATCSLVIWFFGLDKDVRCKLMAFVKSKIKRQRTP